MFQNFLLGFQAGNEQRVQRQTENALSRIGQQAQANDWSGAASTAFGAGMPDLGGQFRGYGEQDRQRQQTQQVGGRLAAGDYAGAQNVAFKTGDLNLGQGILEMTQGLDDRQREQALESMSFFANVAGLEQVRNADPMARADVLRQIISNSPFDNPQAQELLNRAAENGISNEELDTFQMQVLDATQQMQRQQTQQGVALDRAIGEAVAQGMGDEALERQIAALPGGGAMALQMRDARRQAEEQRRQFNANMSLSRSRLTAANAPQERRPLTNQQIISARQTLSGAQTIRQALDEFVSLVQNATPTELANVGREGSRIASAHAQLAILAKGPAALDLGALVGADFAIIGNIIGEPGDIVALLRNEGAEGILARLDQFGAFLDRGNQALLDTYAPFSDQLPEYFPRASGPYIQGLAPLQQDIDQQQGPSLFPRSPTGPNPGEIETGDSGVRYMYVGPPGGNRNERNNWREMP